MKTKIGPRSFQVMTEAIGNKAITMVQHWPNTNTSIVNLRNIFKSSRFTNYISEMVETKKTSLLFADDTVLVAEFPEEMQKTINNFYVCCKKNNNYGYLVNQQLGNGRRSGELQLRYDDKTSNNCHTKQGKVIQTCNAEITRKSNKCVIRIFKRRKKIFQYSVIF